jgi:hypothetical protein
LKILGYVAEMIAPIFNRMIVEGSGTANENMIPPTFGPPAALPYNVDPITIGSSIGP